MSAFGSYRVAAAIATTAEAMTLAIKAGIDPVRMIEVLNAGTGAPNVIPGELRARFNIRYSPVQTLEGLKETVEELPAFVKVAAEIGVKEVYLQRLVFFENDAIGLARPDQALYEQLDNDESRLIEEATALAQSLGMTFSASGAASEPGMSLKRAGDDEWGGYDSYNADDDEDRW